MRKDQSKDWGAEDQSCEFLVVLYVMRDKETLEL